MTVFKEKGQLDLVSISKMWTEIAQEFGLKPLRLFEISLNRSEDPDAAICLAWLNVCNDEALGFISSGGNIWSKMLPIESLKQGQIKTLEAMYELQKKPDLVPYFFICASLFPRVASSRSRCKIEGIAFSQVYRLYQDCLNHLMANLPMFEPWDHLNTELLPFRRDDQEAKLTTLPELIKYLVVEHVMLQERFTPVIIHVE